MLSMVACVFVHSSIQKAESMKELACVTRSKASFYDFVSTL